MASSALQAPQRPIGLSYQSSVSEKLESSGFGLPFALHQYSLQKFCPVISNQTRQLLGASILSNELRWAQRWNAAIEVVEPPRICKVLSSVQFGGGLSNGWDIYTNERLMIGKPI